MKPCMRCGQPGTVKMVDPCYTEHASLWFCESCSGKCLYLVPWTPENPHEGPLSSESAGQAARTVYTVAPGLRGTKTDLQPRNGKQNWVLALNFLEAHR